MMTLRMTLNTGHKAYETYFGECEVDLHAPKKIQYIEPPSLTEAVRTLVKVPPTSNHLRLLLEYDALRVVTACIHGAECGIIALHMLPLLRESGFSYNPDGYINWNKQCEHPLQGLINLFHVKPHQRIALSRTQVRDAFDELKVHPCNLQDRLGLTAPYEVIPELDWEPDAEKALLYYLTREPYLFTRMMAVLLRHSGKGGISAFLRQHSPDISYREFSNLQSNLVKETAWQPEMALAALAFLDIKPLKLLSVLPRPL